ncbi:carotenoid oxygenase family protein [Streptomyces sp. NPDC051664]|uniref:carotenoid oxygenase family protein n=1 Tax=Streptomyces sp. NPDC051664 TaxID=3365668 RepID=UPI0037A31DC4
MSGDLRATGPAPPGGQLAPVGEELTGYDLPVTGRISAELAGWYLRNGPNPADAAAGHWFFGGGMIHGIRLEGGRAASYRNRWVRTRSFADGARTHDDQGHRDLTAWGTARPVPR